MSRLVHVIEKKNLLSSYQSGFRKGRNTMDSVLCLEAEIRKAQVNKEVLIGVFFDVEKAYDDVERGTSIKIRKNGYKRKNVQLDQEFLV